MTNVKSITGQVSKKKYFSFIKVSSVQPRLCIEAWKKPLKACETLWSAREMASVALSAKRERRTENVFHMRLR